MKIATLLNTDKPCVSCEIFPPKPGASLDRVTQVVDDLAKSKPKFISVTYGASGSNSNRTVEIAADIQNRHHIPALAHMTCVCADDQKIEETLKAYKENGIENILALRGDLPQDMDPTAPRPYRYAYQLIEKIKATGDFCIGAACYPEGHVECARKEDDIDHLKQKVDSGCDFMTTQMFFNNDILYHFLYRTLAKGIDIPVIAGIMPVTNAAQIGRIISLSGTYLPPRFKSMVEKFEHNPEAMMQAGIAYTTEQIIDLICNGINRIHIYTMNKPEIAAAIFSNLSSILED
ncbi:MAG: methylenetetrahydrofolate reductase [NAD(P)H] [Oscillospiraceae bacterium]|nr:methylenetetrahydrofolate reductase [NAD(P)H] [Oscillospiraceae bacterium]